MTFYATQSLEAFISPVKSYKCSAAHFRTVAYKDQLRVLQLQVQRTPVGPSLNLFCSSPEIASLQQSAFFMFCD